MKSRTIAYLLISAVAIAVAGCSSGSDPSYSPDPSVGQSPAAPSPGETPGETPGGGTDQGSASAVTADCFENGFCRKECRDATNCPAGFSCVMNLCTFDCQTDAECGSGGKCNAQKLCEAATGEPMPLCTSDAECGVGRRCDANGACEKIPVSLGCQGDINCPAGQYCDGTHQCQLYPASGVSCVKDADCLGNYYCGAAALCLQDCRSDYQCPSGQACDKHGKCAASGTPTKLVSFSFNALGAEADPAVSPTFKSANFIIDRAEITPAGRDEMLTSEHFTLMGSAGF